MSFQNRSAFDQWLGDRPPKYTLGAGTEVEELKDAELFYNL